MDAQNSILVLILEIAVLISMGMQHLGCSELHSGAHPGDCCVDLNGDAAPWMLRTPFWCLVDAQNSILVIVLAVELLTVTPHGRVFKTHSGYGTTLVSVIFQYVCDNCIRRYHH